MRKVTAAVMASTLALSTVSHAAEVVTGDNWHPGESSAPRTVQSHMFDGISLTEHQRQQMRDLMQQARHEQPPVNVSEMETMQQQAVLNEKHQQRMEQLRDVTHWQKSSSLKLLSSSNSRSQ